MDDRIQRLEQLARLLEKGAITRDEFELQKNNLLSNSQDLSDCQQPFIDKKSKLGPTDEKRLRIPQILLAVVSLFCLSFLAKYLWGGGAPDVEHSLQRPEESSALALVSQTPIDFTSDPRGTASMAFRELLSMTERCEATANLPTAFGDNLTRISIDDGQTMNLESPEVFQLPIQSYAVEIRPDRLIFNPIGQAEDFSPLILRSIWKEGDTYKVNTIINNPVDMHAIMICY